MDRRTERILQDVVRKEGRSLLQYVSESYPWTKTNNDPALTTLLQLAKEEQDVAAAVVRFLLKRRWRPPYLGAYPMEFTTINYVSLDHLLPRLTEFCKRRLQELEEDARLVADTEAEALIHALTATKRRHLDVLSKFKRE